MKTPLLMCVLLSSCALASAQEGTGAPGSYFAINAGRLGADLVVDYGHAAVPGSTTLLGLSDGYGPTVHPLVGSVWLDLGSPAYQFFFLPADGNGNVHLVAPIPQDPGLFIAPPIYGHAFVYGSGLPAPGWSITKTVRLGFETLDGYNPVGPMLERRMLHSATSLAKDARDDQSRVFIAGGAEGSIITPLAKDTTEFFNPMKRAFEAGPTMMVARAGHQASLLLDGRVLISGGTGTGGVNTATCEILDPVAGTLTPTGSMATARSAHRQTLLPDGRVLVTGGFSTWVNAATNFAAVAASSQRTAEIYDPASGTWQMVPQAMADDRSGHTQVLLANGRVLIVAGINDGTTVLGVVQIPTFTASCEIYDPMLNAFSATASLAVARGFHGAHLLPSGDVLITGGADASGALGSAAATASCEIWNGATWSATTPLPTAAMLHTHLPSAFNGDAIVMGGYLSDFVTLASTAAALRHDGAVASPTLDVGVHPLLTSTAHPLGAHQSTLLYNGTYLVTGGSDQTTIHDAAFILAEF
jgi:hypothetical protein